MIFIVFIVLFRINTSELTLLQKKQTLSLLPHQWYYIFINSLKDINLIKSTLPNHKISPSEFRRNFLTLYLSPSESRLLNELTNLKIYTKNTKKIPLTESKNKNKTYLIYAHSSFSPHRYSSKILNIGPYYFLSTNQPTKIENDLSVLTIKKMPKIQFFNRWTTGFLQSGENDYIIKNDFYSSNRKYNDRGLNGSNVLVTIIDSGVDVDNCYFNDPLHEVPYNETNFNHRKIVRYDPISDRYDKIIGHGTHCAGIIAGSTDSFPMSLFNGQAPAAKLYVADVGDEEEEEEVDIDLYIHAIEQIYKLNTPIISCSWGYLELESDITQFFDYLVYNNPANLFVFAAGNRYKYYSMSSPADSKNVLAVGASEVPRPYYLTFDNGNRNVKLVDKDESVVVKSNNVFKFVETNGISYIENIELIKFDENTQGNEYSNKAVIIYNDNNVSLSKIYDFLAIYNAKAAIVFDQENENHDKVIILSSNSNDKQFFENHNKININIELNPNIPYPKVANYSSKGSTLYGNMKPDIIAPGTSILSALGGINSNECTIKSSLRESTGTSMATPAVAGSLALVYQYLNESIHGLQIDDTKNITSALLRAFAVSGAGDTANNEKGYGMLNLSSILIYPNIDFGVGLRYCSDKINHNKFISYFVKTDHIGKLSVTIAWIDAPYDMETFLPFFAYFEFYIIGPNGNVYDINEQFSTNKKIVVNNAPIGTYEIRIRMSQLFETEYAIDYSLVVVGPFEQLNFIDNPMALKPTESKLCSSKCPVKEGYAACDEKTATCVCDKFHTGTNCEFKIIEFPVNTEKDFILNGNDLLYLHLDLSKYQNIDESEKRKLIFSIEDKKNKDNIKSFIHYYFNTDKTLPLSFPTWLSDNKLERKNKMLNFSFTDLSQMNEMYLTVYNDLEFVAPIRLIWSVNESLLSPINDNNDNEEENKNNDATGTQPKSKSKTFKIMMLTLIVLGCAVVVCIVVFITIKLIKKKKGNNKSHHQYTDVSPEKLNVTLVDDI